MGAWGTGILDNDVALDAKLPFDEMIESGGSVDDAIASVLEEWDDVPDEDDRADLILALAWLAGERGTVPATLAAEARQVIREQQALRRWDGSPDYAMRQSVERLLLDILDGRASHPGRQGTVPPQV